MSLWDSLRIALNALRTNLLRAILTTLGIVIGVASVIILVSLGTRRHQRGRQADRLARHQYAGRISRVSRGLAAARLALAPMCRCPKPICRPSAIKFRASSGVSGQLNEAATVVRGNANWNTSISGVHAEYTNIARLAARKRPRDQLKRSAHRCPGGA